MAFYKNRIQSRTLHLWKPRLYEKLGSYGETRPQKKSWFKILKYVNEFICVDNTSMRFLRRHVFYVCCTEKHHPKTLPWFWSWTYEKTDPLKNGIVRKTGPQGVKSYHLSHVIWKTMLKWFFFIQKVEVCKALLSSK